MISFYVSGGAMAQNTIYLNCINSCTNAGAGIL